MAHQGGRIATPVEKQQHLPVCVQMLADGLQQWIGQPVLEWLVANVEHLERRQPRACGAFRQGAVPVAALCHVVQALQ